jgi:hypothetical protein
VASPTVRPSAFLSERDLSLPETGEMPEGLRARAIFTFDQCRLLTHCVLLNLSVDRFIRLVRLASNR